MDLSDLIQQDAIEFSRKNSLYELSNIPPQQELEKQIFIQNSPRMQLEIKNLNKIITQKVSPVFMV